MSRNVKIILIIVSSLLAICVLSCLAIVIFLPRVVQNGMAADPARAKEVGHEIADYVLPPGYEEQMGMNFFFQKMVAIGPKNKHGVVIMLMQVSTLTGNREQMQQQMRQAFQNQYRRASGTFEYVGEETVTIKGQPTVLTITESKASGASTMRQAMGTFPGKGGLVMVMVMGSSEEWDSTLLHNFFESIR